MTDPLSQIEALGISSAKLDAGAEALRQVEQGGRLLRVWADLPNSDRKKWRLKALAVLAAARVEGAA